MSTKHLLTASALALLTTSTAAAAPRDFVTLKDDGTLAGKITNPDDVTRELVPLYKATGSEVPDVISAWTTFPMDGGIVETLFDPVGNDVKGIGLEHDYGLDGTFPSDYPPLRAILLHNDVTQLAKRAAMQNAPLDGFAQYLFLLELSHTWGPAVTVPAEADGGAASANALIGFPFHWSFWMDAGSSPAGGNAWKDGGDGTFTVSGGSPKSVRYSMLDLYLMGLADPSEVPAFGVLENAVPPSDVKDPFTGRVYGPSSFPWWGTAPFTVHARRRTLTIDDVVAANGARSPSRSSGTMKLGIVLIVPKSASADAIAGYEQAFAPIAASLAPAYHDATQQRGTMQVVTASESAPPPGGDTDAGADDDGGAVSASPAKTTTTSGCSLDAHGTPTPVPWLALAAVAAAAAATTRRRRR